MGSAATTESRSAERAFSTSEAENVTSLAVNSSPSDQIDLQSCSCNDGPIVVNFESNGE